MAFGINYWCQSIAEVLYSHSSYKYLALNNGMLLSIYDQLFKTTAIYYRLACWALMHIKSLTILPGMPIDPLSP